MVQLTYNRKLQLEADPAAGQHDGGGRSTVPVYEGVVEFISKLEWEAELVHTCNTHTHTLTPAISDGPQHCLCRSHVFQEQAVTARCGVSCVLPSGS